MRPLFQVYANTDKGPPWTAQLIAVRYGEGGEWEPWKGPKIEATSIRAGLAIRLALKLVRAARTFRRHWRCTNCGHVWFEKGTLGRNPKRCHRCMRYFLPHQHPRGIGRSVRKELVPHDQVSLVVVPPKFRRRSNVARVQALVKRRWRPVDVMPDTFE